MKVVSPAAMAALEVLAYRQGCVERDFMEKAGHGVALAAEAFIQQHNLPHAVWLLCGKGNNAGDAFVAGRYLLEKGYRVTAIQPTLLSDSSPLCQENGRRFIERGGQRLMQADFSLHGGLILDGLFGTGFKGGVREPYASLIEAANTAGFPILSIDIPSGLDGATGRVEGSAIRANATLFLGLPKTGFFLEQGWNAVGTLHAIHFGLPVAVVEQAVGEFELIERSHAASLLPPIKRNRHKYETGYVMGLAGSPGMPGAALLSSWAAFRGGCGIVRLLHPRGMEAELAHSPYELIKVPYDESTQVDRIVCQASALFVGPGIGCGISAKKLLHEVMPALVKPCVVDADALTLFADCPFPLPMEAILTPHAGEMQRLLHLSDRLTRSSDLLKVCQRYAEERSVTLVLKGAPTFIFHPQHPIYVNVTGDPGMATAGSGDVLTGLLAALLSQGLSGHQAALLGVYLHGLAGEWAAKKQRTSYGVMATDLIASFGDAYADLQSSRIAIENSL